MMLTNASWIRANGAWELSCPCFRKTVTLKKNIKKATAHVSAMGLYDFYINDRRVGDAVLTPGWTSLPHRVQYQSYDVTSLLSEDSRLEICGGAGWAVGHIGVRSGNFHLYADHVSVIASIDVEYTDGSTQRIVTDGSWQVYTGPVLDTDIYNGEVQDRTLVPTCLGYAEEDPTVKSKLVAQVGEFVREHERVAAKELILTPKGERVIDFGQNLAGYVEIRIKGRKGDRIALSCAEVLDSDGNFYNDNYRDAESRSVYILSGEEEVLKPRFTFFGYRYIRLDEYPFETVDLSAFTSVALYSDMKRTGRFSCGDRRINQLYSNILWGQRSNFVDVPTDCPQRDERLGWTGDAQVFCRTACINYNAEKFFEKWLGDVMLDQHEDGAVEGVVPHVNGSSHRISAAWGDAAVICPWEVYLAYGNKETLRSQFGMMKKWIGYMHGFGEDEFLWVGDRHYGDWLAMDAGYGIYVGATQTDLIASAYFAYSTSLVIRAGKVLGEDVSEYEELYQKVRAAFRKAFMKDGLPVIYPKADAFSTDRPVKAMTQTALVLILHFELYEGEAERRLLTDTLVSMIRENGNRMTTGFVGTPYILQVLSANGRTDVAYDLLLQEENPSWLFSVNHGATTMWEHWDSVREDGTFWSTNMNSFNHYAYGSVYEWIFGCALGIRVLDDGAAYRHISISPLPDRRLGYATASIESRTGLISSSWRYMGDEIRYELEIPDGCVAELTLPGKETVTLRAGNYLFVEHA